MAVAIKNAELFNLTRDHKEELSDLLIDQKIETSRSHSILEAIADGVLVTDQLGILLSSTIQLKRCLI